MKLLFSLFLLVLTPVAFTQNVVNGNVQDVKSHVPVSSAIVVLRLAGQEEIKAYAMTDKNGSFSLPVDSALQSPLQIEITHLSYEPYALSWQPKDTLLAVYLHEKKNELKEVVVKARPITCHKDTLTFHVQAFKSQKDRTVKDILSKLPGIEVAPTGTVSFNGVPINKFYIEGLDLLEGRYSIAVNNISSEDVSSVEVLENHQPVKMLGVPTNQPAINLKLKKNRLSRPVGKVQATQGYEAKDNYLWNGDLFSLAAMPANQTIVSVKSNNLGLPLSLETRNNYQTDWNEFYAHNQLLRGQSVVSFMDDPERFFNNESVLATANNLSKLTSNRQLKWSMDYGMENMFQESLNTTQYFHPDSLLTVSENKRVDKKQHTLKGGVIYEDNAHDYFLNNALSFKMDWLRSNASIFTTDRIGEKGNYENLDVRNKLVWYRKMNKFMLNLSSYMQFGNNPQQLTAGTEAGEMPVCQTVSQSFLFMNTKSTYAYRKYLSTFNLELKHRLLAQWNASELRNRPDNNEVSLNDLRGCTNRLEVVADYSQRSKNEKFRMSLGALLVYYHIRAKDKTLSSDKLYTFLKVNPDLSLSYKFSPLFETFFSFRFQSGAGDLLGLMRSPILINYRMYTRQAGILPQDDNWSFSLRVKYKNPLKSLFFNANLSYLIHTKNVVNRLDVEPGSSFASSLEQATRSRNLIGFAYLGKYIDALRLNAALHINYAFSGNSKYQYGMCDFRQHQVDVSGQFIQQTSAKILWQAKCTYHYHVTKITPPLLERPDNGFSRITQRVGVSYFITKQWEITFSEEYLQDSWDKNVLLDAECSYKKKNVELKLSCRNMLNKKAYKLCRYTDLDTEYLNYDLRPFQVMAKICWNY